MGSFEWGCGAVLTSDTDELREAGKVEVFHVCLIPISLQF